MSHTLAPSFNIHAYLRLVDQKAADEIERRGCRDCAGRLDVANSPRNVRGLDSESEEVGEYSLRFSLCCAREGCRRRATPPSARFFGRRVYAAVVVILVGLAARHSSPDPAVPIASVPTWPTRKRWSGWWVERFVLEPWFAVLASRLATSIDRTRPVHDLVSRFDGNLVERIASVLALLAPLSTRSVPPESAPSVRVR